MIAEAELSRPLDNSSGRLFLARFRHMLRWWDVRRSLNQSLLSSRSGETSAPGFPKATCIRDGDATVRQSIAWCLGMNHDAAS